MTFKFLFLLLLATSLCGCASIKNYPHFADLDIKKIGVLPFINESGRNGAGEIVTNIFITMIFKTGIFQVEERGNIERFLIRNKLKSIKKIGLSQLKKLGKRLNLDAVFIGTVEEFIGGDQGNLLSTPTVSIRARLIDLRSSKILWMAHYRRTGNDYIKAFEIGQIRSVTTLTKLVIQEVLDKIT